MTVPTSHELACLCQRAYDECTVSANDTEVLIVERDEFLILAFRGTTFDHHDIIKNMRAFPWWASEVGGFVHKGFLVGARSIWPHLQRYPLRSKPTVLAGHSKGGAEAGEVAAMMTLSGYPPILLETFGAPRVGFGWIEDVLKGIPGNRYRLGADIVPTVPHRFPFPYRHDRDVTLLPVEIEHRFHNHRIADYIEAVSGL